MASGSSGRNNSVSKGFDFATTDDNVCSYEDYDNEDNYNGRHANSMIGSNYAKHQLCKNPRPNPDIKTLFMDHTCTPPNGALAPTLVSLPPAGVAKPTAYPSLGAHGPFPPAAATANANALAGWMANVAASSSIQVAVVTASSLPVPPNQGSIIKRPITPPATLGMVDYQSTDHEQLVKRLRPAQSIEEVTYPISRQHATWSLDDLPRIITCTMHQGSAVTIGSATGDGFKAIQDMGHGKLFYAASGSWMLFCYSEMCACTCCCCCCCKIYSSNPYHWYWGRDFL